MKKLFILFLIPLGFLSGCAKPSEMVSAPSVQEFNSSQESLELQEFKNASILNQALNLSLNLSSTKNSLIAQTTTLASGNYIFLDMRSLSYPNATNYAATIWCTDLINNKTVYVGKFVYKPEKGIYLSSPTYQKYRYELDWYFQYKNSKNYYYSSQKRQVSNIITMIDTSIPTTGNPIITIPATGNPVSTIPTANSPGY